MIKDHPYLISQGFIFTAERLVPMNWVRWGLLRVHTRLDMDSHQHLYVTDLKSTNETFFCVGACIQHCVIVEPRG